MFYSADLRHRDIRVASCFCSSGNNWMADVWTNMVSTEQRPSAHESELPPSGIPGVIFLWEVGSNLGIFDLIWCQDWCLCFGVCTSWKCMSRDYLQVWITHSGPHGHINNKSHLHCRRQVSSQISVHVFTDKEKKKIFLIGTWINYVERCSYLVCVALHTLVCKNDVGHLSASSQCCWNWQKHMYMFGLLLLIYNILKRIPWTSFPLKALAGFPLFPLSSSSPIVCVCVCRLTLDRQICRKSCKDHTADLCVDG